MKECNEGNHKMKLNTKIQQLWHTRLYFGHLVLALHCYCGDNVKCATEQLPGTERGFLSCHFKKNWKK